MTTGERQDPKTLKGSRRVLLIGRVAYVRIGSLDESGSDGTVVPQNALEEVGPLVGRPNWTEGWSTANREAGSCRTSRSSSRVVSRGYHMEHICIIIAAFTARISYPVASHTYILDILFSCCFYVTRLRTCIGEVGPSRPA